LLYRVGVPHVGILARPVNDASANRSRSSRLRRWARRSRAGRGSP
jgi:hypothetical protein